MTAGSSDSFILQWLESQSDQAQRDPVIAALRASLVSVTLDEAGLLERLISLSFAPAPTNASRRSSAGLTLWAKHSIKCRWKLASEIYAPTPKTPMSTSAQKR